MKKENEKCIEYAATEFGDSLLGFAETMIVEEGVTRETVDEFYWVISTLAEVCGRTILKDTAPDAARFMSLLADKLTTLDEYIDVWETPITSIINNNKSAYQGKWG